MLENAIWWHVFPLGALGAPAETGKSRDPLPLDQLESWLDYMIELDCNGLLLGPIFSSRTHGYDTIDHFHIDARLGGDEAFDHLMEACSQRGIAVVLDGVFNHVSHTHPFATDKPHLFHLEDGKPRGWEGIADLLELNHNEAEVAEFVENVMAYWLDKGIAGWRLDVAYAIPPEFLHRVISAVKQDYPNAIFIGEMIHGDYTAFVNSSGVDTTTQYELWKGIWSSLKDSNPFEASHALSRHADFASHFIPQTFVSNHDVTRIASQVGPDKARLAAAMLLTLPGSPSIYYGDEQGYTGIKTDGFGGDDQVRPHLPPKPENFSDLGSDMYSWYRSLIAYRRRHPFIATGALTVTHTDNDGLSYEVRRGEDAIQVSINYTDNAVFLDPPLS